MRDIANRHKGLPERTPEMLFQIVDKFTRGALHHYEVIEEKKDELLYAYEERATAGGEEALLDALTVLFWEFHFYVTCWLQVELALYRLLRVEATPEIQAGLREVFGQYRTQIERHVHVRRVIDSTREAVEAQFAHFGPELDCVVKDQYWFDGVYFTVDEASVDTLRQLHQAIMRWKF
ncbi:hypothetical protein ACQCN2_00245 [Brevibacillus ginsengisoli]|uniref:hypothetical protein n=1 Tax=Brevibacillus ginsengisoli TaxID=363854 RepID=UPI003CE76AC2